MMCVVSVKSRLVSTCGLVRSCRDMTVWCGIWNMYGCDFVIENYFVFLFMQLFCYPLVHVAT